MLLQNFLNSSGKFFDHKTVKLGSGPGPKVFKVFKGFRIDFSLGLVAD